MKNGDFLRTKSGEIGKIIDIRTRLLKINDDHVIAFPEENILVSNEDIFYVIFPNDYINGKRVRAKVTEGDDKYFLVGHNDIIYPDKVSSIISAEKYNEIQELKKVIKDLQNKANCIIN